VIAAVVVAGAVGALLRYLTSLWLSSGIAASRGLSSGAAAYRNPFPWAVLIVNVIGSAVGGAVLALAVRGDVSSDLRLILLTGFCGGLTTFSTFSVESVQLVMDGKWRVALASVAANLVLGVAAAAAAYALLVA